MSLSATMECVDPPYKNGISLTGDAEQTKNKKRYSERARTREIEGTKNEREVSQKRRDRESEKA